MEYANAKELHSLCGVLNLSPCFAQVAAQYGAPYRYYHNLTHIDHMLGLCKSVMFQFYNIKFELVELATWFHDIVYIPGAKDNEERSVDLMFKLIGQHDLSKVVAKMILATKTHIPVEDRTTQLLLDLDLAGFADPDPQAFALRQQLVAKETLTKFGAPTYEAGRQKFLTSLLNRPFIYGVVTDWEGTARENITRELEHVVP